MLRDFKYFDRVLYIFLPIRVLEAILVYNYIENHLYRMRPWSGGYWRRLMFKRSWVQTSILDGQFSHDFVVQVVFIDCVK